MKVFKLRFHLRCESRPTSNKLASKKSKIFRKFPQPSVANDLRIYNICRNLCLFSGVNEMKVFTLVLVMSKSQILLGLKKRGLGVGKWNGFGGKVEMNETVIQGAIRELHEESGVVADECNLLQRGIITMFFTDGENPFKIHVFQCNSYEGEITETEEMKPQWFDIEQIPYDLMWDEARLWYPVFLSGCPFEASFYYDDKDDIIKHVIHQFP